MCTCGLFWLSFRSWIFYVSTYSFAASLWPVLLWYSSGVFSTGEFKPCWSSLQVCCCSKLHNFRLCKYMGPWPCLPNFWGHWFLFRIDPWYSFIQRSDACIWEAQEGRTILSLSHAHTHTQDYTMYLTLLCMHVCFVVIPTPKFLGLRLGCWPLLWALW